MELITMQKNSRKYGFKKGDVFPVMRNIMDECVIIRAGDRMPNIILSEAQARYYGTLTGKPQLYL